MLKISESNHYSASLNSTPYYNIPFSFELEEEDILLTVLEKLKDFKDIITHRKFPWVYVNFYQNSKNNSTLSWKIHISANIENYIKILDLVVNYCLKNTLNFKFNSSTKGFYKINGKLISPASAGKFIVIYCLDKDLECILQELYEILKDFKGPYILSDKQYKDSQVLYYRYGEYLPISLIQEEGHIENFVLNDKLELVQDERVPYYRIFDWVKDKNFDTPIDNVSKLLAKYQITEIISNKGSITCYSGYDSETSKQVFIKEARNYLGIDSAKKYSRDRVKNEYFLLKELRRIESVVKPIELIEEGGNTYLIEEFIDCKVLTEWLSLNNFLYRSNCQEFEIREYLRRVDVVMMNIISGFLEFINKGVFINDISPNNIFVDKDLSIKFIDLEYAYRAGDNDIADVYTPGFESNDNIDLFQQELDKLQKLICYLFLPFNNMYVLDSSKQKSLIKWFVTKYNDYIPNKSKIILLKILNDSINRIDDLIEFSAPSNTNSSDLKLLENSQVIKKSIDSIILSFNDQIDSNKNYIFPADPQIFNTNIYSLSHGCFGVLYALKKLRKDFEFDFENIKDKCLLKIFPKLFEDKSRLPKGLFMGTSGIAWSLLEIGQIENAKYFMKISNNIEDIKRQDYYYGLSGILITNLKFYLSTEDRYYKEMAFKIYNKLKRLDNGDINENGYGEGFSGISLAILYFGVLFDEQDAIKIAEKFLKYDISRCQYDDRGKIGINREGVKSERTVFSPYFYDGIAGLGTTIVRMYAVTGNEYYLKYLNKIIDSSLFDVTLFPTYNRGMSGLIDFLLDCLLVVTDNNIRQNIVVKLKELICNLQLFYKTDENLFFGEQLFKLSTDLVTGTSGILLALNRYDDFVHNKNLNFSDMFNLDQVLSKYMKGNRNEIIQNYQ